MGIFFENLSWNVNGHNLKEIFISNDASTMVLKDQTLESVHGFKTSDWTISNLFTGNQTLGQHFIKISGKLYKICAEGCVFKFSDDGTHWTKISGPLGGKILNVTATVNGFVAIINQEEFFHLKLFTVITDAVTLETSTRLPICSKIDTTWMMSRLDERKLAPGFVKFFFKEISLVLTDLVLISCPNGFILVYPIIGFKFSEPVPIFWDNDILSSVDVIASGLIFFYKSGKIVMITPNIQYHVQYLSTCIHTSALVSIGNFIHIVWSDKRKLYYSSPLQSNNLIIQEFETNLTGIVSLSVIGSSILAGNVNKTFYKIAFDNNENLTTSLSLKNVIDIGNHVDKLKTELGVVDSYLDALESDGSKISVKFSGQELILENLGLRTFKKNLWGLEIESCRNNVQFVKKLRFDRDFEPSCVLKFPVDFLLIDEKIIIRLICDINREKLVILNVPFVFMEKKVSENGFISELQNIL